MAALHDHLPSELRRLNPENPGAQHRRWHWTCLGLAALAFVIPAVLGCSVLARAHPHEDAFILFKYARLLAEGHGIAYWPGGPPTEGATDFLWMVLLAALHAIGLDVALAAVLVNAVGGALLVFAAARLVGHRLAPHFLAGSVLAFLFGGPAFAAYLGFGSLFYCAVVGALFVRTFEAWSEKRYAPSIVVLGLVVSLIRPDGVILAVPFAVIGAVSANRNGRLGRYLGFALLTAALGGAYFAWRWAYFGLPLPLPLYVKSHGSETVGIAEFLADPIAAWPGLGPNLAWLTSWGGPAPFLFATAILIALARRGERVGLASSSLLCLMPGVALLIALSVARQTQNIGSRFQAPVLVLALLTTIAAAACVSRGGWRASGARGRAAVVVAFLSVVPGLFVSLPDLSRIWARRGYVDTFAVEFGRDLAPGRVLALTEAGRLAYWTDARVEDLVGLNTAQIALAPVDLAYLTQLNPDVVLFYAGPFDLRSVTHDRGPVVHLDPGDLARAVRPEFQSAYEHGVGHYTRVLTPEKSAALVAAKFLESTAKYEIYAVSNEGNYSHVYGFRAGMPELAALLKDLAATTGEPPLSISYLEARGSKK